jgi:acyl-CoA reductase-like NAD-dependent aldehyde dehydrogenase/nicotinamidase-related amidase
VNKKPALLLVDVQWDYLRRANLSPEFAVLESSLVTLLASAREHGWPVFHVQTQVSGDGSDAMPHWKSAGYVACVKGTTGAQPPHSLAPRVGEAVFYKRYYSGFEDPRLLSCLREVGAETLIVAGLYTHACVRSTVLDAYAHGFTVFVPTNCVGSYDQDHSEATLDWLDGRAAKCLPLADIVVSLLDGGPTVVGDKPAIWLHRSPIDWSDILDEVELAREVEVASTTARIARHQSFWKTASLKERAERLSAWKDYLTEDKARWVEELIREVGKPRVDAEGEVRYGLALLEEVCSQLRSDEQYEHGRVRYRPHGLVGLITPWNNPFAIPIGKIAPALGYGNGVLWKPALPASRLSRALHDSLVQVGLDRAVGLLTGDAFTGHLLVKAPEIAAISFTGSVSVGRQLMRLCGRFMRPLQAELGGNNAAIVLTDADVDMVAQDLAGAMFSFAGQRCTAIRRVIVVHDIFGSFVEALRGAVDALKVGLPSDHGTHVGPVISKTQQIELLAAARGAVASGGRLISGGGVPGHCPESGCWIAPTVMTNLAAESPIVQNELFGPIVALLPAKDFDEALALHNRGEHGLLGALFSHDQACRRRFLAEAEAGILVINQARPAFAASGPFVGWKASGFGLPEHGRWNRDFYTKVQAVYIND